MKNEIGGHPAQPGRTGYVVLHSSSPSHYLLVRNCVLCNNTAQVLIPAQGLWDWEHGASVQVAFPELSAADREVVLSGSHSDCFDAAFPDEDASDE